MLKSSGWVCRERYVQKIYDKGLQQFPFSRVIGYYSFNSINSYFNLYKGLYYGYLYWKEEENLEKSILELIIKINHLNKNNQVINCRLSLAENNYDPRMSTAYEDIN